MKNYLCIGFAFLLSVFLIASNNYGDDAIEYNNQEVGYERYPTLATTEQLDEQYAWSIANQQELNDLKAPIDGETIDFEMTCPDRLITALMGLELVNRLLDDECAIEALVWLKDMFYENDFCASDDSSRALRTCKCDCEVSDNCIPEEYKRCLSQLSDDDTCTLEQWLKGEYCDEPSRIVGNMKLIKLLQWFKSNYCLVHKKLSAAAERSWITTLLAYSGARALPVLLSSLIEKTNAADNAACAGAYLIDTAVQTDWKNIFISLASGLATGAVISIPMWYYYIAKKAKSGVLLSTVPVANSASVS